MEMVESQREKELAKELEELKLGKIISSEGPARSKWVDMMKNSDLSAKLDDVETMLKTLLSD
eukprot:750985-Hanusia_phi.AAC.6